MLLNCGIGEDSWESLGQQGVQISRSWRKLVLNIHWKDRCWSSNTLATWCEELTHWKRPWCWEGLKAGGEGDDRQWDGWMASLTQWTWVWASSGSWCWTGRPGVLQSIGSQRIRHSWVIELICLYLFAFLFLIWYNFSTFLGFGTCQENAKAEGGRWGSGSFNQAPFWRVFMTLEEPWGPPSPVCISRVCSVKGGTGR